MASADPVMAAAEALDDDEVVSLIDSLTDDARRALAGALRVTTGAFRKARSPRELLLRSMRRLPPNVRADVAHMLTIRCLDDAVEALGDDADDPTREQLDAALDPLVELHGIAATRLMLAATTALPDAKARVVCAEVLATDPRFALPGQGEAAEPAGGESQAGEGETAEEGPATDLDTAGKGTGAGGDADAEAKRAERRRRKDEKRREAQRQREAAQRARAAQREARKAGRHGPAPVRRPVTEPEPEPEPPAPRVTYDAAPPPERRPVRLVGRYDGLVPDDPAIGDVVLVPVPYADDDEGGKTRPAVVVGATRYQYVVRPCYSEGGVSAGDWRSVEITDVRSAGLDGASFVSDEEVLVAKSEVHETLGRLAPTDWNQL
jgi:hypothetical protein